MLRKNNLEIMTAIFFGMITFCAVFVNNLSLIQRIMLGYMFLYTLHEWEEMRFPGGFANLMSKFFGIDMTSDQLSNAHIPVALFLIVITFVPFGIKSPFLALVSVYIGLFEAFIHIVGIKIHKMNKPYTPGMITAIMLGITSISVLIIFVREHLLHGIEYALAVPLTIIYFIIMQRTVLAIYGFDYKYVISIAKKKLGGSIKIQ